MESSGERFVGTRKISKWYDDPAANLPLWLVKVSTDGDVSYLTITEEGGTYSLRWHDTDGNLCTVTSLKYSSETLYGGSGITIEDKPAIALPNGAEVGFGSEPDRLTVSLVGNIGDGEPGTFIAEADPPPPVWLRWFWRLFHRRP